MAAREDNSYNTITGPISRGLPPSPCEYSLVNFYTPHVCVFLGLLYHLRVRHQLFEDHHLGLITTTQPDHQWRALRQNAVGLKICIVGNNGIPFMPVFR